MHAYPSGVASKEYGSQDDWQFGSGLWATREPLIPSLRGNKNWKWVMTPSGVTLLTKIPGRTRGVGRPSVLENPCFTLTKVVVRIKKGAAHQFPKPCLRLEPKTSGPQHERQGACGPHKPATCYLGKASPSLRDSRCMHGKSFSHLCWSLR